MKRLLLFLVAWQIPSIAVDGDKNGEIDFHVLADEDASIINQRNYEKYFREGNNAFKAGNMDEAIENFKEASVCNPRSPQPYFNLALCYEEKKDIDNAIDAYKKAIAEKPHYPKAHHQLGKLLQTKEKIDEAITHYQEALKYMEYRATLRKNGLLSSFALQVARLFVDKEKFADSIPYYEIALEEKPDDVIIRFEYANSLNTTNHTQQALDHYRTLLTKRPNDSSILYNIAYTLKKLGRVEEAMPYYAATLEKNPNHAEAHFSLGLAHLSTGEWDKGWPEYEWRWQRGTQLSPRDLKQPLWDGTPLHGKKILLHAEQGLGDTFQFIRYAKIIKEQYGGYIILGIQSPLYVLAIRCFPYIDKVIPLSHIFTETCDVQAPLLSLPLILKTTQETVPTPIPYIEPEPALLETWKKRLQADHNFKVGICWQGNSKYSSPFLRSVVAAKSIPLEKFQPLLQVPGVSFYSLQKQTGEDQLQALNNLNIKTFDDDFDEKHGRFMDTSAVIKYLDLVITIDTSICHLTGALGTPVWVMIPEPPDWRWMIKRNDSPWYPHTMRLFRQPQQGDWNSVIATITRELYDVVHNKKPLMETPEAIPAQKTAISVQPHETSSITSLKKELTDVSEKLIMISKAITSSNGSLDNTAFMQNMRTFYMLNEIRTHIQEKIAALEGVV